MPSWDLSKRSGNQKSPSISAVSVAGRTAIKSACGIRHKLGALLALLALVAFPLVAAESARSDRVESALSFAEGRRADAIGLSYVALQAYTRAF